MHPYYHEKLAQQRHEELTAAATAYRTAHDARAQRRAPRVKGAPWGHLLVALAGRRRRGAVTQPRPGTIGVEGAVTP